jgi:hypothetical protein
MALEQQQVNVQEIQRLNDAITITLDAIRRVAPQLAMLQHQQLMQQMSPFGGVGGQLPYVLQQLLGQQSPFGGMGQYGFGSQMPFSGIGQQGFGGIGQQGFGGIGQQLGGIGQHVLPYLLQHLVTQQQQQVPYGLHHLLSQLGQQGVGGMGMPWQQQFGMPLPQQMSPFGNVGGQRPF